MKLTVTATMMITMPKMMKVMLSNRARRPSLRAPSRSPCCTLLRDCRERAEKFQEACPSVTWVWKPCSVLVNYLQNTFPATHSLAGSSRTQGLHLERKPLSEGTSGQRTKQCQGTSSRVSDGVVTNPSPSQFRSHTGTGRKPGGSLCSHPA